MTRPSVVPSVAPSPIPTVLAVGGEVTEPRLLTQESLPLPEMCQGSKMHFDGGPFVYEATISESGTVSDVRVVRMPTLKPACPSWVQDSLARISKWRYEPARLRGTPVAVRLTITQIIDVR
jgi:hypothetical protein